MRYEPVIVGGRRSGAFRFDHLACGLLEANDGLNRAAFVPPQEHDRADDEKWP